MSKFTPGEHRTRGGGRAVVLGSVPETGVLVGYAYAPDGGSIGSREWYPNGEYWPDGNISPNDLMPPKRTVWVNMYADGEHYGYNTREEANTRASKLRIACIRVEYTEGEGL